MLDQNDEHTKIKRSTDDLYVIDEERQKTGRQAMTKPVRVFIIEDEEGLADFMRQVLQMKGYDAFYATDGVKAVELFEKERPDITLIDVDLGYSLINGIEVLQKIKDIDRNAFCFMVTRITDDESVRQAKQLGAAHYILKPLGIEDLSAAITKAVQELKQRSA